MLLCHPFETGAVVVVVVVVPFTAKVGNSLPIKIFATKGFISSLIDVTINVSKDRREAENGLLVTRELKRRAIKPVMLTCWLLGNPSTQGKFSNQSAFLPTLRAKKKGIIKEEES